MEWRIFIPLLTSTDNSWIPDELFATYSNNIENVVKEFGRDTDDSRIDEYLVCDSNIGIKYRNKSKLEVKIRNQICNTPPGAELWTKQKYGKKGLAHYQNDIVNMISNLLSEGERYQHMFNSLPSSSSPSSLVRVQKHRRKQHVSNTSLTTEICYLSLLSPAPSSLSLFSSNIHKQCDINELSTSGTQLSTTTTRQWLSIAVEGESSFLSSYLQECSSLECLWTTIATCLDIVELGRERKREMNFLPVFSGYPQWIEVVMERTTEREREKQIEIANNVLEFVHYPWKDVEG
mmetsp:Transcript_8098/g.8250  ORF Transcript_8098/g.8250 Transcript_8098/m.8250 type:complete len:291 (+) Transcript_8098:253-1125(+)